ncbi:MAG: hypothetical protein AAF297_06860 [Planctomycetota bacterium]
MDRRRQPTLRFAFCGLTVGLAVVLTVATVGCAQGWQGRSPIRASLFAQGLRSALPAETPVPAVVAAAEDVLAERGLVIAESSASEDFGRVIARPNFEGYPREVTVRVSRTLNTTEVRIAAGVGEGAAVERDILERMLTRLGL